MIFNDDFTHITTQFGFTVISLFRFGEGCKFKVHFMDLGVFCDPVFLLDTQISLCDALWIKAFAA